jgi:WD40 repeat protein
MLARNARMTTMLLALGISTTPGGISSYHAFGDGTRVQETQKQTTEDRIVPTRKAHSQSEFRKPLPLLRLKESIPSPFSLGCDGNSLTIAGRYAMSMWDLSTGKRIQQRRNTEWWMYGVSADGKIAALRQSNEKIRILDTLTAKELCQLTGCDGFSVRGYLFTFSADNCLMASDSFNDKSYCIRFWDAATGKELPELVVPNNFACIALSPDRRMLALGYGTNGAELYDITARTKLRRVGVDRVPHPKDVGVLSTAPNRGVGVKSVVFSRDGKTLAVGDNDGNIHLYELATGTKRQHCGGETRSLFDYTAPWVAQMMFSRDGKTLVSLDRFYGETGDPKIHLWEVATGGEICALGREQSKVNTIALSPDDEKLASAGDDGTVVVWDLGSLVSGGRSKPVRLSGPEMEGQWADLMGMDVLKARSAVWTLVSASEQTVGFLQQRLLSPSAQPPISRWIMDLDRDDFARRNEAMAQLRNLGDSIEPELRQALGANSSLEFRRRAEKLLGELEFAKRGGAIISPARLCAIRSVEVLELIGNAEAKRLLASLSRGTPGIDLTQRAKEALERLATRPLPIIEPSK